MLSAGSSRSSLTQFGLLLSRNTMPSSTPHLQTLIAHYLATNYPVVLEPFLEAAQIPPPNLAAPPSPDLRTLVQDFLSHDLAQDMDTVSLNGDVVPAQDGSWRGWKLTDMLKVEMPSDTRLSGLRRSLEGISASNLLTIHVGRVPKREFDTASAS